VTLAIVSLTGLAGVEVVGHFTVLREQHLQLVAGVAAASAVLLVIRFTEYFRKTDPLEVLRFYRHPHYWGVVLLSVAAIVLVAVPLRYPVIKPVTAPRAEMKPPPPTPVPLPPEPEPPKPPVFPEMKVAGVVLNGSRSTAVINGDTFMVGEDVMGTRLMCVEEMFIVVEKEGFTNKVPLGLAFK
jgi:hypothetical protein